MNGRDILEAKVDELSRDALNAMLNNIQAMDAYKSGKMFRFLKYRIRNRFGDIDRVGFRMKRYGIFVDKGVGWFQGIGDEGPIKPKPWFSDYWDNGGLDRWADEIVKLKADIAQADSLKEVDALLLNVRFTF